MLENRLWALISLAVRTEDRVTSEFVTRVMK